MQLGDVLGEGLASSSAALLKASPIAVVASAVRGAALVAAHLVGLLAAAVEAVGEGFALLPVRVAALERVRRNEALSSC